ncbi:MAG TPA: hypothetical protein VE733_00885 [Streptosporangiaceae bacterium]|nr:hypothetical protein [Streptosporangiaceae bacterium]
MGVFPHALTAVFLTHVHSDYVVDLPDLAMARWLQQGVFAAAPLHAGLLPPPAGEVPGEWNGRTATEQGARRIAPRGNISFRILD